MYNSPLSILAACLQNVLLEANMERSLIGEYKQGMLRGSEYAYFSFFPSFFFFILFYLPFIFDKPLTFAFQSYRSGQRNKSVGYVVSL